MIALWLCLLYDSCTVRLFTWNSPSTPYEVIILLYMRVRLLKHCLTLNGTCTLVVQVSKKWKNNNKKNIDKHIVLGRFPKAKYEMNCSI